MRWAGHDVGFHRAATKQMHHPLVGDLTLAFDVLELPADPELSVLTIFRRARLTIRGGTARPRRWSETRTKPSAARVGPET
jgi:hypothetical protein